MQLYKNVNSAFRLSKVITIASIVSSFALVITVVFAGKSERAELLSRLDRNYVIANGQSFQIEAHQPSEDDRRIEAVGHITRFHELFFNLSPDQKAINKKMKQALSLVDESGNQHYSYLKENKFYTTLVSQNIRQQLIIPEKAVQIDTINYDVHFTFTCKQILERSTSLTERELVTRGTLRNVDRSENNTHGMLIANWQIVSNHDIRVLKKETNL